jgi:hypothetical protein
MRRTTSLIERLAEHFRRNPNVNIDGRVLSRIAGYAAWRTRISELRHAPYFMTIVNTVSRVQVGDETFTESTYRYVPPAAAVQQNLLEGVDAR